MLEQKNSLYFICFLYWLKNVFGWVMCFFRFMLGCGGAAGGEEWKMVVFGCGGSYAGVMVDSVFSYPSDADTSILLLAPLYPILASNEPLPTPYFLMIYPKIDVSRSKSS